MPASSSLPHNILITGATGFVGRHLTAALRQRGAHVIAVSRHSGDDTTAVCDVTDASAVERLFTTHSPIDAVVHLAAIAHKKTRLISDAEYMRTNVVGLNTVIEAAIRLHVPRFVFLSSASVYSEFCPGPPVREDARRDASDAYARSKKEGEDICFKAIAEGYECVVLRPPAIYSRDWIPDVRKRAYIPGLGKTVLALPPGTARYSFCAVGHVVAATIAALDGTLTPGVYNVADDEVYDQQTVREVVAAMDGATRRVRISPRLAGAALAVVARLVGKNIGNSLWVNYRKLFQGQVLDLSRIKAAGVTLSERLPDLVRD